MNRLLTDEQAAYLAQLYTGTDAPKLHETKLLDDNVLELIAVNESIACKCDELWCKAYGRGMTIHRLERRLHKANRKYKALHRAMHEDTERVRGSLIKAAERLSQSIITPSTVEWPRFEDREPVLIGNWIAAEMGPFKVGSILFCDGHVLIYDEQHFHYVKLRDGEFAEHDPYGRR